MGTLTPEERAAIAAYDGPVTRIPEGVSGEVVEMGWNAFSFRRRKAVDRRKALNSEARERYIRSGQRASWRGEGDAHLKFDASRRVPVDIAMKFGVPE